MIIPNYDVKKHKKNDSSKYKQLYSFMPDRCFRMLICGPSGCGKTNLVIHLISNLLYYDKIYLYAKNLHQDKYQFILKKFQPINKEIGYQAIEATNGEITPLSELDDNNQKLVVFDDYLNTGSKNDSEIKNYFTNSRNKNCSCIYLSQSFYNTDKTIRLNCSHYCIFDLCSKREQNMVCHELGLDKSTYQYAIKDNYKFLYFDKPKKTICKNFDEKI